MYIESTYHDYFLDLLFFNHLGKSIYDPALFNLAL